MFNPELQKQINALSKKLRCLGRIKYNDGPLTGSAGCFVFGIDLSTGDLYYKDTSGNWTLIASGSSEPAWLLAGNLGTTAGTDFVGTSDSEDFVMKANSTEYERFVVDGDSGLWGNVINSNYITTPSNFPTDATAYGGAAAVSVAGGMSLSVPTVNFTAGFYIPNKWPVSVLAKQTYTAVGVKTAANNGLILMQEVASTALPYWARLFVEYNFNTGIATAKLQNTVPGPPATLVSSAALPAISVGNRIECVFDWDYITLTATITNLDTLDTESLSTGFSGPNYAPTVYFPGCFLPLTTNPVVLESYVVNIAAYKNPDFNFVGHSVLQGYSGVTRSDLVPELIRTAMPDYRIQVDAMGSMRAQDMLLWIDEIDKINAKYVVLMAGANDSGISDGAFYAAYDDLRNQIVAGGSQVIHFGQLPLNSFDMTSRNAYLKSTYEGMGDIFIDIFPLLKDPSSYQYNAIYDVGDGIHPSVLGNQVIVDEFMRVMSPLLGPPTAAGYVDFSKLVNLKELASYETQQTFLSDRNLVDKGYVKSVITTGEIKTITGDITLTETDYTVLVDGTVGPVITITLPTAASVVRRIYNIKKLDNTGTIITIQANGAETIDGANTQSITTQYASYQIQSDGTSWWII